MESYSISPVLQLYLITLSVNNLCYIIFPLWQLDGNVDKGSCEM